MSDRPTLIEADFNSNDELIEHIDSLLELGITSFYLQRSRSAKNIQAYDIHWSYKEIGLCFNGGWHDQENWIELWEL